MNYRTLFNVGIGRLRFYGDMDTYCGIGVSFGLSSIRIELACFGFGLIWRGVDDV